MLSLEFRVALNSLSCPCLRKRGGHVGCTERTTACYKVLRNSSPLGWLGSRVVSVLDSGAEGPGFKSQSRRCRVTVLGKLFTPIVPLFTKQHQPLKGCQGSCRPGGK